MASRVTKLKRTSQVTIKINVGERSFRGRGEGCNIRLLQIQASLSTILYSVTLFCHMLLYFDHCFCDLLTLSDTSFMICLSGIVYIT